MDVFIVETPFQLLSCYEAINSYNLKTSIIIVKYSKNDNNNRIIDSVLKKLDFQSSKLIFIKKKRLSVFSWLALVYNFSHIVSRARVRRVFIGDFRSIPMQSCLCLVKNATFILLDDGSITLEIVKKYLATNKRYLKYGHAETWLIRLIQIVSGQFPAPNEFSVFTCFNVTGYDKVRTHTFNALSRYKMGKTMVQEVHFYGSDYKVLGISEERVVHYLRAIQKYCENRFIGCKIKYLPHRKETDFSSIEELGFDILPRELPAEIEAVLQSTNPVCIAGFVTGALQTLAILNLDSTSISFFPKVSDIKANLRSEFMELKLAYSKDSNIELVEL